MISAVKSRLLACLPREYAPLDREAAERLRAEQLSTILNQTPNMMIANICNAIVLLAAFSNSPRRAMALLWALAVVFLAGTIYSRYKRRSPGPRPKTRRSSAMKRLVVHTLSLSLCWAAVPLLFFPEAPSGAQILVICLCAGTLSGGAFALASIPFAAVLFMAPIFAASATTLLRAGGEDYLLAFVVLIVYTLVLLRGAFAYAEQLRSRVLRQLETEQRVRTDALTSLPNRLWFYEAIEAEFARISADRKYFALIYADLDDFKIVNDRLGHAAGDELLIEAAERMKSVVRPTDLVARLGGDEFAVVVTSIDEPEDALVVAQRVIQCFEAPFSLGSSGEVSCAASLGVAIAPRDADNPHSLLRKADIALYRAKQNGGPLCVFEPHHEAVAREERALERDLRRAIQQKQFALVFQPLLDFDSGMIVGCEALLRWEHSTRGQVPPSIFIPIAERTGFIHDLGLWVIEEACRTIPQFPKDIRVAVNVSAVQLRAPDFAQRMLDSLSAAGVSSTRLGMEITETALLSDDQATNSSIRSLARAGVEISLDDFGTGYASLSYLRKLPLHKIKIDRSFVKDILERSDCEAITRGVIKMAADLGISCVGEGVEDARQLSWLRRNGCSEAQGFLISRPLSAADFNSFIASWDPQHVAA